MHDDVLSYWFHVDVRDAAAMRERIEVLFTVDRAFDTEIRERWGNTVDNAIDGRLDVWRDHARGALALVILLDQMPRNIFRGTAKAFAGDARARTVAEHALRRGFRHDFTPIEQVFFYMPFEHAEDLELQNRCVAGYEALYDAATTDFRELMAEVVAAGNAHRDVIRRFGRFPHRNAALGRDSTAAERAWLETNRNGWGQGAADLET